MSIKNQCLSLIFVFVATTSFAVRATQTPVATALVEEVSSSEIASQQSDFPSPILSRKGRGDEEIFINRVPAG